MDGALASGDALQLQQFQVNVGLELDSEYGLQHCNAMDVHNARGRELLRSLSCDVFRAF